MFIYLRLSISIRNAKKGEMAYSLMLKKGEMAYSLVVTKDLVAPEVLG